MSQENVDLLRRGFEYVSRTGELPAAGFQPDLVWDTTTFMSGAGMNVGTCIGLAETNRWLAEWAGAFEDWSLDLEEIFDGGDQVVTFVRQRARAKQGGPELEMRFAQVWTFRDGLVARMEMYRDGSEALEAVRLRE